jgi:hypothetical protein
MPSKFQVIALSSVDPDGSNTRDEPKLLYPDALNTARELKSQGKAFRVFADSDASDAERQAFLDIGALE